MLPPSPQQIIIASVSPDSKFWTLETISPISIVAVFEPESPLPRLSRDQEPGRRSLPFSGRPPSCFSVVFIYINRKALDACHFAASSVCCIKAVNYPAACPAQSDCHYSHRVILYIWSDHPVIHVISYSFGRSSISYRIIHHEEKSFSCSQSATTVFNLVAGNPNRYPEW